MLDGEVHFSGLIRNLITRILLNIRYVYLKYRLIRGITNHSGAGNRLRITGTLRNSRRPGIRGLLAVSEDIIDDNGAGGLLAFTGIRDDGGGGGGAEEGLLQDGLLGGGGHGHRIGEGDGAFALGIAGGVQAADAGGGAGVFQKRVGEGHAGIGAGQIGPGVAHQNLPLARGAGQHHAAVPGHGDALAQGGGGLVAVDHFRGGVGKFVGIDRVGLGDYRRGGFRGFLGFRGCGGGGSLRCGGGGGKGQQVAEDVTGAAFVFHGVPHFAAGQGDLLQGLDRRAGLGDFAQGFAVPAGGGAQVHVGAGGDRDHAGDVLFHGGSGGFRGHGGCRGRSGCHGLADGLGRMGGGLLRVRFGGRGGFMGRLRLGFDGGGRRRGRGCGCGKQILLRRVGQGRKHRHHHGQAKHQCHQPFFHLQTHPSISARLPVDSRRNSVFSGNADSPHVDMLPRVKIDAFSVRQIQPTDGFLPICGVAKHVRSTTDAISTINFLLAFIIKQPSTLVNPFSSKICHFHRNM